MTKTLIKQHPQTQQQKPHQTNQQQPHTPNQSLSEWERWDVERVGFASCRLMGEGQKR